MLVHVVILELEDALFQFLYLEEMGGLENSSDAVRQWSNVTTSLLM